MKLVLLFLLLITTHLSFSQNINVSERPENIGQGINNSLCIELPVSSLNKSIEIWKDKMRNANANVKGNKYISASNAIIPTISSNYIDIYAKYKYLKNSIIMIVAFDLGNNYINSKSNYQTFESAKKFLIDYSIEVKKCHYDNQIKIANDELLKQRRELETLKRKRKNSNLDIARYKKLMAIAEADTLDNNIKQDEIIIKIKQTQFMIENNTHLKDSISAFTE